MSELRKDNTKVIKEMFFYNFPLNNYFSPTPTPIDGQEVVIPYFSRNNESTQSHWLYEEAQKNKTSNSGYCCEEIRSNGLLDCPL